MTTTTTKERPIYLWRWRKWPATEFRPGPPWESLRYMQRCMLARGKLNSAMIQFEDGYTMIASRNGLRRIRP